MKAGSSSRQGARGLASSMRFAWIRFRVGILHHAHGNDTGARCPDNKIRKSASLESQPQPQHRNVAALVQLVNIRTGHLAYFKLLLRCHPEAGLRLAVAPMRDVD